MENTIFLEHLFKIMTINNIYIVGSGKSELEKCIIKNAENNNCNIYYSSNDNGINYSKDARKISNTATQILAESNINNIYFDLVFIDEPIDDLEFILEKILNTNGVIISKNNNNVTKELLKNLELVYDSNNLFAYHCKNKIDDCHRLIREDISKRIKYTNLKIKHKKKSKAKLKVGIGIITYNHSKYILDCLNNVFKQKGDFDLKIVIVDDFSLDNTTSIIDEYLEKNKIQGEVKFIKNSENKGVINSIKVILNEFSDTDYFTFCEGDDYWISSNRISKFLNYMNLNPYVSVAFNSFYIYNHNTNKIKINLDQYYLEKENFITQELIEKFYFIGNLGCCFYDSFYLKYFDEKLFELPLYDFFFNTYYSTFGLIGHLKELLSVYRIHNNSFWSTLNANKKNNMLFGFINKYNDYFNYIYDHQYTIFQDGIVRYEKYKCLKKYDLLIIDNVFPNSLSPFSYEEISSYLDNIDNSMALCTYSATAALNKEKLSEGLIKYKQSHPEIAHKVTTYNYDKAIKYDSKLMYFIFKSTTMNYYDLIKKKKCNFVFELYPGGGLYFDDPVCDNDLRKIMKLKGFKKVIVTQEPVKKYLLKKKLCKANQIEMIFGVVMNEESIIKDYPKSLFYGKNKNTCDIVFMAHKYNELGKDKGYDLFIDTAKKLCEKYDNIYFHVVGNFDKDTIDVETIKDHIRFYGTLEKSKFDEFFKDKDMIISPNRPGILANGAFDGFPTASCTEAGVRKVVMLCSDELDMCQNYYSNGENIIIIKNNVNDIAEKIENLYNNPNRIEEIAEEGRKRIMKLYSYDSQINPRVELLKKIINKKGV